MGKADKAQRILKICALLALMPLGVFSGCSRKQIPDVQTLSLQDPRLSLETRRWLADTEDEVVIMEAEVEMAAAKVERVEEYRETLNEERVFIADASRKADVENMERSLRDYVDAQLVLERAQLKNAEKSLELARARLTQVRAETAIRYDLAVYPLDPIVVQVENLKIDVAATQSTLEDLRVTVEKRAADLWREYTKFVKNGGITRNFWKFRTL